MEQPRIRVSRRGAARWRERGHPWIYRSDVVVGADAAGVVEVTDEQGGRVGTALWSPTSQIAVRMLTTSSMRVDASFWRRRLESALAYRAALAPDATACRLVHGEADGLPSVVVDRYGDCLVVQLLSAGVEVCRMQIIEALVELCAPTGILARHDVPVRRLEQLGEEIEPLHGAVPEEVEVREASIRYVAAPWSGQKTGAFLDQRENRVRAGELARGRALDCFCYHGSFALHMARRADHVVAVDASAAALERAGRNAVLNGTTGIEFVEANVFDFLRALDEAGERFDTIVLDPPAFAKRRAAVEGALRGYKELNLRALRILSSGGILCTFSCSYHLGPWLFRDLLESAAADAGRPVRWLEWRGQAKDHPELLQVPETAYLKGAVLQVI